MQAATPGRYGIDNLDHSWGGIDCSLSDSVLDCPAVPAAIQTLHSTHQLQTSESEYFSSMGIGNYLVHNNVGDTNEDVGSTDVSNTEVNDVRNLTQAAFRGNLSNT